MSTVKKTVNFLGIALTSTTSDDIAGGTDTDIRFELDRSATPTERVVGATLVVAAMIGVIRRLVGERNSS